MNSSQFRIRAGQIVHLKNHDSSFKGRFKSKEDAEQKLIDDIASISSHQEILYAENKRSVLMIFQAMDAAGKDGAIRHVMSGINPQGCDVTSFKAPSVEELDHDYLWRCAKVLPRKGRIGIFNRSYYEEVLVVRVHPEILAQRQLHVGRHQKKFWKQRFHEINEFERYLAANGTVILKFFLNVSREEQKKRFLERIEDSRKNWKFSLADVKERKSWDSYMAAYESALSNTSTPWAPWHIIPADKKWFTRVAVADILLQTLKSLHLAFPKSDKSHRAALQSVRKALLKEK